jgi:prenyltransferase beta subunit
MAWPSNPRRQRTRSRCLALAVALSVALLICTFGSASAKPSNETNKARLDSTVRFLQEAQNPDGGFGGNKGQESNQDFSAWVTFALAADSINPQDQATANGEDAYTYLTSHAARALHEELCRPAICTTSLERELLVADAAGASPYKYGEINLVSELLVRKLPDGSFPFVPGGHGEINDTIFAILALSLVADPPAQSAVRSATEWLIAVQNQDGSFSPQNASTEAGEVDMTGAALQALNAPGQPTQGELHQKILESQQKALKYLREAQGADGGFPERPGEGESNVASTAWAVQGLWAAGENPETWTSHGSSREPLDYMASLQQPDGHIRYKVSEDMNGVWMTAYVAPAFAGQPLPVPPGTDPPKEPETPPPPITATSQAATSASGSVEHGQGGESFQPGSGVIAGGGGDGAPLFSRPQPQSKGSTPGGARQLSSRAVQRSLVVTHRNPGAPRRARTLVSAAATSKPSTHDRDSASGSARKGLGAAETGHGNGSAGRVVKGVLIDSPSNSQAGEAGAPGLRGAGAGGNQTSWLAITIVGALLLAAIVGMQLERHRPEVIV